MPKSQAEEPAPTTHKEETQMEAHWLVHLYGEGILYDIADNLYEQCDSPFAPDGSITDEGMIVAQQSVEGLFSIYDNKFFADITDEILTIFRHRKFDRKHWPQPRPAK